jgi:hypothetical protein
LNYLHSVLLNTFTLVPKHIGTLALTIHLTGLVAGFLSWWRVFELRSGHVGFVVCGEIGFLRVVQFPLLILIPPTAQQSLIILRFTVSILTVPLKNQLKNVH